MEHIDRERNIDIKAGQINIGRNVTFGKNIKVRCKGVFEIGDFSRLGDDTEIYGNNVKVGKHLFHSKGLRVGGGGRQHPNANLTVGDRCTIHNNFINACEPVTIGDDVGLSPEVSLITHGYWMSALEGFPAKFEGITISSGAIVGYRSVILMGATIPRKAVVAAHSVVTGNLKYPRSVYAGNPARYLRTVQPPTMEQREATLSRIAAEYIKVAEYHGYSSDISITYPLIRVNMFIVNVETLGYEGIETEETDDFRDYIRKWGIRIYTERPFKSKFEWEGE